MSSLSTVETRISTLEANFKTQSEKARISDKEISRKMDILINNI